MATTPIPELIKKKDDWRIHLAYGIKLMLETPEMVKVVPECHRKATPARVVRYFESAFSGVSITPESVLKTSFEEGTYNEMVHVEQVDFVSYCSHHLLPFQGTVDFAYIPNGKIVGLSKIPRMIDVLAARPQVQEQLTIQIVDTFMTVVEPRGCGCVVRASHGCTCYRGVKKTRAQMKTTALRGIFLEPAVKSEFLASNGHR